MAGTPLRYMVMGQHQQLFNHLTAMTTYNKTNSLQLQLNNSGKNETKMRSVSFRITQFDFWRTP